MTTLTTRELAILMLAVSYVLSAIVVTWLLWHDTRKGEGPFTTPWTTEACGIAFFMVACPLVNMIVVLIMVGAFDDE